MTIESLGGCGYTGFEYGYSSRANAECFGGRLYDLDHIDHRGMLLVPDRILFCPNCNTFWHLLDFVSALTDTHLDDLPKSEDWKIEIDRCCEINFDQTMRAAGMILTGKRPPKSASSDDE